MPKQDITIELKDETVNELVEETVMAVGDDDDANAEAKAAEAVAKANAIAAAGPNGDIVEDWWDDYPAGSELFCARYDADDFDERWTEADYTDGATVAVRRGSGMPPQGWILRHAHLSDLERTKAILEKHASADALAILYDLKDGPFDDFLEAWGKDGGMQPGKSNRSARRSASTRHR